MNGYVGHRWIDSYYGDDVEYVGNKMINTSKLVK